jgi:hypothetical protein
MKTQRRWMMAVLTESAKPGLPALPWQHRTRATDRVRADRLAALQHNVPRHALPQRAAQG